MRPEACAAAREALHVETTAPTPDETVREGEMEGALHAIGELGYRAASVRTILEYSGGHRRRFYEHFSGFDDCYEQAYATWIDRLSISLFEAAVLTPGWRAGVRAGLMKLFQFAVEQPSIARALFIEVHVAGGAVQAEHERAVERIATALDSVRGDIEPDQAPPETTGLFVVGGVEACLCDVLSAGDQNRVWDAVPELMRFITGSYLDRQAADEEFEEVKVQLERDRAGLESEGQ